VVDEVTCISMISSNCHDILVPNVYAFAADVPNPFVAAEHIDGEPLSTLWSRYTENDKLQVVHRIAGIIMDMGEMCFKDI